MSDAAAEWESECEPAVRKKQVAWKAPVALNMLVEQQVSAARKEWVAQKALVA